MSGAIDPPDDDLDALAGEYCLGLLPPAQAAAAARRLDTDPAFAAAVQAWTVALMPLVDALPQVAPPAGVWAAVAARTAPAPRRLRAWRFVAVGALAAAAALVFALRSTAPVPLGVARLASASEGTFVATAERRDGAVHLIVDPEHVSLPAGRAAELWMIAPGAAPKPMGVLSADHPVDIAAPGAALALVALAVSIEPPGGSPTGRPTGPVIASAKFSSL